MNASRYARVLTYILAAVIAVGAALSSWRRAHDPFWKSMGEVRTEYDIFAVVLAVFGAVAAYGLWSQRSWGRKGGLSFASTILMLLVSIRIYAAYVSGSVTFPSVDELVLGVLSAACIFTLSVGTSARDN